MCRSTNVSDELVLDLQIQSCRLEQIDYDTCSERMGSVIPVRLGPIHSPFCHYGMSNPVFVSSHTLVADVCPSSPLGSFSEERKERPHPPLVNRCVRHSNVARCPGAQPGRSL